MQTDLGLMEVLTPDLRIGYCAKRFGVLSERQLCAVRRGSWVESSVDGNSTTRRRSDCEIEEEGNDAANSERISVRR